MTDDQVDVGEIATVDVVLEGELQSSTLRSYLVDVTFDRTLLRQPSKSDVRVGAGLPGTLFWPDVSVPGRVRFGAVFFRPAGISSGQALATIDFRTRESTGVALASVTSAKLVSGGGSSRTPAFAPPGEIVIGGMFETGEPELVPDASLAVPFYNNESDFATMVSVFNKGDEPVRAMLRMYPTSRAGGAVGESAVYDVVIGPGEADLVNTLGMVSESGLDAYAAGNVSGTVGGIVVDLFGIASDGEAILDDVSVGAFVRGSNGAMFKAPVCPIGTEGVEQSAPLFINRDGLVTYILAFNTSEDSSAMGAVDLVSGGGVSASIAFEIPPCGIEIVDTAAATSAVGRPLAISGTAGGKAGGVILDVPAGVVGMVSVFDDSGAAVAFNLAE